jgi:hypothetical protein
MEATMQDIAGCAKALGDLARGSFAGWRGIPPGCSASDIARLWPEAKEEPAEGKMSGRSLRFCDLSAGVHGHAPTAWFDDRDRVVQISIRNPRILEDVQQLLAGFGDAETKIESGVGYDPDAEQWVYASRGVTFFVRDDWTVPRVVVYPPTTAADYAENLGASDKKRYF